VIDPVNSDRVTLQLLSLFRCLYSSLWSLCTRVRVLLFILILCLGTRVVTST